MKENVYKQTKERSRRHSAQRCRPRRWQRFWQMHTPIAETPLHSLERAAADIGLHVNAHNTVYMSFNQTGGITTRNGSSLKLVDKFTYLWSSVSLTETDINTRLAKAWTAIDRLSVIWKSDLIKWNTGSYKQRVMSILLYGCTTWTLHKGMEKNLDGNYTRMLQVILNKS